MLHLRQIGFFFKLGHYIVTDEEKINFLPLKILLNRKYFFH